MDGTAAVQSTGSALSNDQLKVMIVDDSAVIRGIFRRTLEADDEIEVIASVSNGKQAVDALAKHKVDVIVLDIEMPVMDGMTALPLLLEAAPDVKIIMASTLTEKNAAVSLQALRIGASDYIPKPTAKYEIHSADTFKRELVEKVKALAGPRRVKKAPVVRRAETPAVKKSMATAGASQRRNASNVVPRIIAVGSSTGGPQEPLEAGRVYVAPGDYHMFVEKSAGGHTIRLNQEAPENYCRPSVEPLFRSVAAEFGPAALALMLTGMGHDGVTASETLVDAGGTLIAQDEETSVVWGMPGAVANAGLCADILPLDKIAPRAITLMRRN